MAEAEEEVSWLTEFSEEFRYIRGMHGAVIMYSTRVVFAT